MNGLPAYAGEIANPLLLMAIESTRQHLAKAGLPKWSLAKLPKHPATALRAVDDPELLKRWQGDCRASVLRFQATQGLSWRVIDAPNGNNGKNPRAVPVGQGASLDWPHKGDATSLVSITRPERPILVRQAQGVLERASERSQPKSEDPPNRDRLLEISVQVTPQFAFWTSVLPIHPQRMPRTIELMELALELAFVVGQRFKHALAVPRPHEIEPRVCPALLTPGHSSLPSGHATEAFTMATLMTAFLGDDVGPTLRRLAQRIADNREVAGLHYAIDTLSGQVLGTVLGSFLVARCSGGEVTPGIFNGPGLEGSEHCRDDGEPRTDVDAVRWGAALRVERDDQLHWLWQAARLEWGADPGEDQRQEATQDSKPAAR